MNTKEKLKALIGIGLTQLEIANETAVSQATISRILAGKHADIKASTADSVSVMYEKYRDRVGVESAA